MTWLTIQTQANYERKVAEEIQNRINKGVNHLERIHEIFCPMVNIIEHKNGKPVETAKVMLPKYIFLNVDYVDGIWHALRDIRGFQGFIGAKDRPSPVPQKEIDSIKAKLEVTPVAPKVVYSENEKVRINEGPFKDFYGVVSSVDYEKNRIKVNVTIFGRETPVELTLNQIVKEVG